MRSRPAGMGQQQSANSLTLGRLLPQCIPAAHFIQTRPSQNGYKRSVRIFRISLKAAGTRATGPGVLSSPSSSMIWSDSLKR
jgi:hypothetical protein